MKLPKRGFSIFSKLMFSYFLVVALTVFIMLVFFYNSFKMALLQRTTDQLTSINILKRNQMQEHLSEKGELERGYLAELMQQRTGMGYSGESYVVDGDFTMLTASRFISSTPQRQIKVRTVGSSKALAFQEGHGIYRDYRNILVIGAYGYVTSGNKTWAIISEIDYQEAMNPVNDARDYLIIMGLVIVLLVMLVSWWLAQLWSKQVRSVDKTIVEISKGVFPEIIAVETSDDEFENIQNSLHILVSSLEQKAIFAHAIGSGKFGQALVPASEQDVLGIALNKMKEDLILLKETDKRILRMKSAALLEGEEQERKRVAMELHDGLGQILTGLKFRIDALEERVEDKKMLQGIVSDAILEARRISNNLMPSVILDFGLEAGLRKLGQQMFGNSLIFQLQVVGIGEVSAIDFPKSICLFRIAQEAFQNIVKYAKASEVTCVLSVYAKYIQMVIEDNGIGMDIPKAKRSDGHGLKNMRERAKLQNGDFSIWSEDSLGVKIFVTLPINEG